MRKAISDSLESLWKFVTSIKLSVVLLLTLAATSIIGTLIPQNKNPEKYLIKQHDVTDLKSSEQLFEELKKDFKTIDLIVYSSGNLSVASSFFLSINLA